VENLHLHTVAATIDTIAPRLSTALVSRDARTRLVRIAGALPASLTDWIYLECRLRRDDNRVDLIARVDERGRDLLTGENPIVRLVPAPRAAPVWNRIRALARAWSDASSPLFRGIERVWLEFDIHTSLEERGVAALPAPGVFVEFAREVYAQHRRDERLGAAMAALRPLIGGAPAGETARNLRRCWELLPSSAAIPYVGVFPARGTDAVRVSIAGLSEMELPAYLRALRWPGSQRDLANAIAAFLPRPPASQPRLAIVNLDVHERIGSGVGLEYILSHAAQLRGRILERALLDRLVRLGACSAAAAEALRAWPMVSHDTMAHELWRSRVCRRVNHLKLCVADRAPIEVKAYLSLSHEYRPTSRAVLRPAVRLQHSTR
jgi:hypothetical protein